LGVGATLFYCSKDRLLQIVVIFSGIKPTMLMVELFTFRGKFFALPGMKFTKKNAN
jgi:hypothetical protein